MAYYSPSKKGSPAKAGDELMRTVVAPEVQPLLDQLRKLAAERNLPDMIKAVEKLSAAYRPDSIDAGGEDEIDFADPLTQLVYTIRYGVSHVLSLFAALERARHDEREGYSVWLNINSRTPLSVCSIAGGPGTDIFAFLAHVKWLQQNGLTAPSRFFEYTILDRCTDWQTMYRSLGSGAGLPADTRYMHFDFESDFDSSGGGGPDTWIGRLREADVVTMVKFSSIIQKLRLTWSPERILRQFVKLFSYFKIDGLFIYMDTDYSHYTNVVTEAARKVGFRQYYKKSFKVKNEPECIGGAEVQQDASIHVQLWWIGQYESR